MLRLNATIVTFLKATWFALSVTATIYPTRFQDVTWDDANWVLSTTNLNQHHYHSRISLANGYIGINVAALGPFFDIDVADAVQGDGNDVNGWPLFDRRQAFATVAGFYDVQQNATGTNDGWLTQYGWESVISGVPHWSGLSVEWNSILLGRDTPTADVSNFETWMNLGTATMHWKYLWTPQGSKGFDIEYTMFVNKLDINHAAVALNITAKGGEDQEVVVYSVLDGSCAVRSTKQEKGEEPSDTGPSIVYSAVSPDNLPDVIAWIYATTLVDRTFDAGKVKIVDRTSVGGDSRASIVQRFKITLKPNVTTEVEKSIGVASSDAFPDPQKVARAASLNGASQGFAAMHASHVKEWETIMPRDSVDSYYIPETGSLPGDANIIEHQIHAVNNAFHLLQSTVGANAIAHADNNAKLDTNSIAVCGLGSSCYGGQIFWDVEVWMAPGLVVAFPEAAKQVANYRAAQYAQAKANIQDAYTSSQASSNFSPDSAIFPWTSGRNGNCTGIGPCFDYEYHVSGDIALELENYYYVTGDVEGFRTQYFPIYDSVAQMYSALLRYNAESGLYELLNATDPDEYANNVNNPGYTMVLISSILSGANRFRQQFGIPINNTWTLQAAALDIPTTKPADIILEYKGMNGTISVKQADVVLIDDFLNYKNNYTLSDLSYYAARQSANGPGMTYGVFSIVEAQVEPSGCADYTFDHYGSIPYARGPWFQYSEQLVDDFTHNGGTHPAFPFLTGMGGAYRVAVFGYLGYRLRSDSFNIKPTLPPQIKHLAYRVLYWQGHAILATSNHSHTVLTRKPQKALKTAKPGYSDKDIPVTIGYNPEIHFLSTSAPLTFPTRNPGAVLTVPNNLAQCRLASSLQSYVPGHFPLSAVDGVPDTKWQPTDSSIPATLTVDLGKDETGLILGFEFDWGHAPPAYFSVAFTNSSQPGGPVVNVTERVKVEIVKPYKPDKAAVVKDYYGNTTELILMEPVWGGRFAVLTIDGNLAGWEAGATVAEWAVVKAV